MRAGAHRAGGRPPDRAAVGSPDRGLRRQLGERARPLRFFAILCIASRWSGARHVPIQRTMHSVAQNQTRLILNENDKWNYALLTPCTVLFQIGVRRS